MLWLLLGGIFLWGAAWALRRFVERGPLSDPQPEDPGGPDPECELHIGDELDLHGVPGSDVPDLVEAYLDVACERGWRQVKIVHGKGIGVRRQQVRALVARHPCVLHFADASTPGSGWGATVVHLAPAADRGAAGPPRSPSDPPDAPVVAPPPHSD